MGNIYIGNGGIARKSSKIYVGVGGIARQAKKIYIGDVNGIARQVYSSAPQKLSYTISAYIGATGYSSGTGTQIPHSSNAWLNGTVKRNSKESDYSDYYYMYISTGMDSTLYQWLLQNGYTKIRYSWNITNNGVVDDYNDDLYYKLIMRRGSNTDTVVLASKKSHSNWSSSYECDITSIEQTYYDRFFVIGSGSFQNFSNTGPYITCYRSGNQQVSITLTYEFL